MFFGVWEMVLTIWNDIVNIPFFGSLSLADVVLWIFTFVMFLRFFISPLIGGKTIL